MLVAHALFPTDRQQPVVANVNSLVEITPIELGIVGIVEKTIVGVKIGIGDDTRWWIRIFGRILPVIIVYALFE